MATLDKTAVAEKYDEVSRLETPAERREFLGSQTPEMRAALWLENIDRKTRAMNLSAEQKEILEVIKAKFVTVEFAESVRGKAEDEAGEEYHRIMNEAHRLFGRENMRELFADPGDNRTLKNVC